MKDKEKARAYRQRYYQNHRQKWIEYLAKQRRLIREAVIQKLGGKCLQCGITDIRVLQINHKNGNGRKDYHGNYSNSLQFYRGIISGKRRLDDLDLRCANCNIIYDYERGIRRNVS